MRGFLSWLHCRHQVLFPASKFRLLLAIWFSFFDSGKSTVSGAKFRRPYKIGEIVPKLYLVLTFHQALCVLKSVLVHKRPCCIILVIIHLHIFELANPISGRSVEGNWVLFAEGAFLHKNILIDRSATNPPVYTGVLRKSPVFEI